ncbi:acyl carrier protein [Gordonia humi]|uniref:Acyl carrier protein n=1 Tax=Gordonia humi TaxID=686429 RepID=A0A840F6C4_9ACTN|nr:acyl carrier protein [Gordonia humi]MBB4135087.1 acyl carrier protein [Gordonia humi]
MTHDHPAPLTVDDVCAVVTDAIAARHGRTETIDADTQMLLTGMLDSLTLVAIVAELEKRLDAKLPEDMVVARNFRTPTALHTAVSAVLVENVR